MITNVAFDCSILCDHCFKHMITLVYEAKNEEDIKKIFIYSPTLCENCWRKMGRRISQLVANEELLKKIVKRLYENHITGFEEFIDFNLIEKEGIDSISKEIVV